MYYSTGTLKYIYTPYIYDINILYMYIYMYVQYMYVCVSVYIFDVNLRLHPWSSMSAVPLQGNVITPIQIVKYSSLIWNLTGMQSHVSGVSPLTFYLKIRVTLAWLELVLRSGLNSLKHAVVQIWPHSCLSVDRSRLRFWNSYIQIDHFNRHARLSRSRQKCMG